MRPIVLILLFCAPVYTQTAQYPNTVVTDNQLMVAKNQLTTVLKSPVAAADTTIVVQSTAGFAANMLLTIDNEILQICSVNGSNNLNIGHSSCPNVDGRGFDGSTAVGHVINRPVGAFIDAWHHNAMAAEVKAIETALGPMAGGSAVFNVKNYGAKGDGVADDTAAINAAATAAAASSTRHAIVQMPAGTYKVTNAIVLTGTITLTGPGAVITVPPTFNLSANGVISLKYAKDTDCMTGSGLCPGSPSVTDLTIRFQNTDTPTYSQLIAFPPGIACGDMYGCDYAKIDNVEITQAMTGIKITPTNLPAAWSSTTTYSANAVVFQNGVSYQSLQPGNLNHDPVATLNVWWYQIIIGGGVRITKAKVSAFDFGIFLDGSDSEMTLSDYWCYPWDMTTNHGQIWPYHGTCLNVAALYDLNVTNFTASNFYRTISLNFDGAVRQYCPSVNIAGLVVDTYGEVDVNCGDLHISSGIWKIADTPTTAYKFASIAATGSLTIAGSQLSHAPNAGISQVYKVQNNGGVFGISNSVINLQGNASLASGALVFNDVGGAASVTGNLINLVSTGFNFSSGPIFQAKTGSRISFTGNNFSPQGASLGNAMQFDAGADSAGNYVASNAFNGWGATYPTSKLLGVYQSLTCHVLTGSGPPNGTVTGNACDTYYNTSGGTGTTLYVKETGSGTNTGWVAK